jgi:hypothetical protein
MISGLASPSAEEEAKQGFIPGVPEGKERAQECEYEME